VDAPERSVLRQRLGHLLQLLPQGDPLGPGEVLALGDGRDLLAAGGLIPGRADEFHAAVQVRFEQIHGGAA